MRVKKNILSINATVILISSQIAAQLVKGEKLKALI
jgi:hypothetical protein